MISCRCPCRAVAMATWTEDHCVFQTVSYNGRLDFIHYFDAAASTVSAQGVSPLVVLRGNGFELHGDTTGLEPNHAESFSVRLHEVREGLYVEVILLAVCHFHW